MGRCLANLNVTSGDTRFLIKKESNFDERRIQIKKLFNGTIFKFVCLLMQLQAALVIHGLGMRTVVRHIEK